MNKRKHGALERFMQKKQQSPSARKKLSVSLVAAMLLSAVSLSALAYLSQPEESADLTASPPIEAPQQLAQNEKPIDPISIFSASTPRSTPIPDPSVSSSKSSYSTAYSSTRVPPVKTRWVASHTKPKPLRHNEKPKPKKQSVASSSKLHQNSVKTTISASEITHIKVLNETGIVLFVGLVRPGNPHVIFQQRSDLQIESQKPQLTTIQ